MSFEVEVAFKLNIIWINGSFRNREKLQYYKTADSVLLSLFLRTNGKLRFFISLVYIYRCNAQSKT